MLSSIPVGDPNLWNGFLYYYFPNQLPVFLCGVILFFLISTPREQLKISPIVFLIFSSLFLFDLCTGRQIISSHIRFGLIFILIGYALSQKPYYLLVNPLIRYIGKVSFGIYFTHFAVLHHLGNWSQEILARTFGEYRFYQIINKWGGCFNILQCY